MEQTHRISAQRPGAGLGRGPGGVEVVRIDGNEQVPGMGMTVQEFAQRMVWRPDVVPAQARLVQGRVVRGGTGEIDAAQAADALRAGDELQGEILRAGAGQTWNALLIVFTDGEADVAVQPLLALEAFALDIGHPRGPGQGMQSIHGQGAVGETLELVGAGLDTAIEQVADCQQALRLPGHLDGEHVADGLAGRGQASLPVGALQALQPDIAEYHQGTGD
ncbi:hypothetical protein D3C84_704490 [compost metagenome]